jgi:hypothetical protein
MIAWSSRLLACAISLLPLLAGSPLSAQPVPTPAAVQGAPYPGTRAPAEIARPRELMADLVGVVALGRVLWSTGYDQIVQSPDVWDRSGEALGRRFATRSAQLVAIEGTRHGMAALLGRDPGYVPCACAHFWGRVGHVTLGTVTDFDADGRRRVGWPRMAGAVAGAMVLGRLQPGQGTASIVALRAVTTVGASWLGNVAREFGVMPGTKRPAVDASRP